MRFLAGLRGHETPQEPPEHPAAARVSEDVLNRLDRREDLTAALQAAYEALPEGTHRWRLVWLADVIEQGIAEVGFYVAGLADGATGSGRVQQPCVDPEEYARIYNAGYADAEAHGRGEISADDAASLDLVPFREVRAELGRRMRESGGGVQHAYMVAYDLLGTAFAEIGQKS